MGVGEDLSADALAAALPGRTVRSYPALLSTQADALAWARAGAPEGALVVADYQASARGRAGLEWQVHPGEGLGFSVVLRPALTPEQEGWLYSVVTSGLADVVGPDAVIRWPDEVLTGEFRAAAAGLSVELGPNRTEWAVASVLVTEARPPRAPLLARLLDGIEQRYRSEPERVLADYRPRCVTLGHEVRARLIPLGPGGPQVRGRAVDCRDDGSLVIETREQRRVAVRPQHLALLDDPPPDDSP